VGGELKWREGVCRANHACDLSGARLILLIFIIIIIPGSLLSFIIGVGPTASAPDVK
jgi:hypothetical protein